MKGNELEMLLKEMQGLPKDVIETSINKILCERSLYDFFLLCIENVYTHIEFENNWHYEELCNLLQERIEMVFDKKPSKHLLINLPIRAGKSILISEIVPVWIWIRGHTLGKPSAIQNVCATQRLATKSSRMSKLIITSDWFQSMFPDIQLCDDNKSKSDYSLTDNSVRSSFGITSSIVGSSYDFLIVDDPNDPKDTHSDTSLRNVIETYKDVISGRMTNQWGLRIVLQQRTSAKDLCQHLLDENAKDYRHVCIPAEITKDTSKEFIKFYKDGLFFPARYGRKRLDEYKGDLTPQAYASQLLQAPSSLAGEILLRKWFPLVKQSEFQRIPKSKIFLFLDTAYTKDEKNNDPTGFYICMLYNTRIYIIKAYEKWLEFHELMEEIKEVVKIYGIKRCYIEAKATGKSIAQELKRDLRGVLPISEINPGSASKTERARAIQTYLINEGVVLVEDNWNEGFLTQIANFPFGKHDEHVDNLVYSVLTLLARGYKKKRVDDDIKLIKQAEAGMVKDTILKIPSSGRRNPNAGMVIDDNIKDVHKPVDMRFQPDEFIDNMYD